MRARSVGMHNGSVRKLGINPEQGGKSLVHKGQYRSHPTNGQTRQQTNKDEEEWKIQSGVHLDPLSPLLGSLNIDKQQLSLSLLPLTRSLSSFCMDGG